MKSSDQKYTNSVDALKKSRALIFLGFAGLFVAGTLSAATFFNLAVPCGPSGGCETVANDAWSTILLGIPNAYLGLGVYAILTAFASSRLYVGVFTEPRTIKLGLGLSGFSLAFSLILLGRMIFFIKSLCPWCITSDVILALTFGIYYGLYRDLEKKAPEPGPSKGKWSFLVPGLAVLCFIALFVQAKSSPSTIPINNLTADTTADLVSNGSHVKNQDGALTVIEFGDIVCPACKTIFPKVEKIIDNSQGRIRFIFHEYPLVMLAEHKDALNGALLGEMVAEKGTPNFWNYLQKCYEAPVDPTTHMVTLEQLMAIAQECGVNLDDARKRINSMQDVNKNDPALLRVEHDMELGGKVGVHSTPTYIVLEKGKKPQMYSMGFDEVLQEPQYAKYYDGPSN